MEFPGKNHHTTQLVAAICFVHLYTTFLYINHINIYSYTCVYIHKYLRIKALGACTYSMHAAFALATYHAHGKFTLTSYSASGCQGQGVVLIACCTFTFIVCIVRSLPRKV